MSKLNLVLEPSLETHPFMFRANMMVSKSITSKNQVVFLNLFKSFLLAVTQVQTKLARTLAWVVVLLMATLNF